MIARFEALLGKERVWEVGARDGFAVELGTEPAIAVRPDDAAQCAAVLRSCAELGLAAVPWGGGCHQRIGNLPARADVVLLTGGLNGIVDHDAADQTIAVRAGTRLADVVSLAREHGQFLPLDPPGLARATVGGVFAAGVNGPLRAGYGLPRDLLLGTTTAHPDGAVARSGGRLVKNVTGFDLHRLYHGSLGTLAVLCDVNLRLLPMPEADVTLAAPVADLGAFDAFHAAFRALRPAPAPPAALLLADVASLAAAGGGAALGGFAADEGSFALLLRFHGFAAAAAAWRATLHALMAVHGIGGAHEVDADRAPALWTAARERFRVLDDAGQGVLLRLSALPMQGDASALGGLVESLEAASARHGALPALGVEPFPGLVRIFFREPPPEELLAVLEALARANGALLAAESAPAAWRAGRDAWFGGAPAPEVARRVARALDPHRVLDTGRLDREDA